MFSQSLAPYTRSIDLFVSTSSGCGTDIRQDLMSRKNRTQKYFHGGHKFHHLHCENIDMTSLFSKLSVNLTSTAGNMWRWCCVVVSVFVVFYVRILLFLLLLPSLHRFRFLNVCSFSQDNKGKDVMPCFALWFFAVVLSLVLSLFLGCFRFFCFLILPLSLSLPLLSLRE